jgi:hypothetical protein
MVLRPGWIALVLAGVVALLACPLSAAAENEWSEAGDPDQPWVETDPGAPPMEMIQPLHRRLPRFFLNHSLFYSPEPLLLRSHNGQNCGQRLPDLIGSAIDFDFRFWYLFIGAHLAFAGDSEEQLSLGEYALRGGAIIPFGEHFSIVHAVWIGLVHFEPQGVQLQSPFEELAWGQEDGLQLGTSLGVRIMLTSWFGLTADVAVATTLFDSGLGWDEPPRIHSGSSIGDGLRLNRWQAMSGLVFAW